MIPVHPIIPGHRAKHHFGMLCKIGVQGNAVCRFAEVYPTRLHLGRTIPLLQEDDIRGNFRTGIAGKGIIGQPDRAEQIGPLCQVFPYLRGFGVHRVFGGDESDDAARTYLIERFGKKVIMDVESQLVVSLIQHLVIAKWHVANGEIIEIPAVCGFKACHLDMGMGIKLLGDPSRYTVQLRTV